MAHQALVEAAEAAAKESRPVVHDLRLLKIVTTYTSLAEAHLREGKMDLSLPDLNTEAAPLPAADRSVLIRRASAEWQRAAALCGTIINPTYRSEFLANVAEDMAYGSQTIVNDFPAAGDGNGEGSA